MLYDEMLTIAQNVASQQGGRLGFNDTICVARTVSGRVVIGISSSMMMNNMPMTVHAEVDLCNRLLADKDTGVAELSLFSAANFQPVLPCNECIARLMSLNGYNAGAMLLLPDKSVPLTHVGQFSQNPNMPMPNMGMGGYGGNPMNGYPNMGGYMRPTDQQSLSLEQLQGMSPMPQSAMGLSRPLSAYAAERSNDDSGLLKNRLNRLLSEEDLDEEEETEKEKDKPKKKFKLFK